MFVDNSCIDSTVFKKSPAERFKILEPRKSKGVLHQAPRL